MANKKSQEGMVGFVMVVVVVAVIFLVFLGITLRKPGATEDRTRVNEVSIFLDAMLEYTTDCEVAGSKLSYKDAIIEAHETNRCPGTGVYGDLKPYLSDLSKKIIEESWNPGADKPYKGYILEAVFETANDPYRTNPNALIINPSLGGGAEREAKTAEKPIGQGITVTLKIYENLGAANT